MSQQRMIDQEHSDDSGLRKEAPTLFGIPDHDPFIVEKDLFERFPHQVQGLAAARNRRSLTLFERIAIAVPALALVLLVLHARLTPPEPSVATAPIPSDSLLFLAAEPFDTRAILESTTPEEWPLFDSVTVQLTPEEALAYIDRYDIDLIPYLDLE